MARAAAIARAIVDANNATWHFNGTDASYPQRATRARATTTTTTSDDDDYDGSDARVGLATTRDADERRRCVTNDDDDDDSRASRRARHDDLGVE